MKCDINLSTRDLIASRARINSSIKDVLGNVTHFDGDSPEAIQSKINDVDNDIIDINEDIENAENIAEKSQLIDQKKKLKQQRKALNQDFMKARSDIKQGKNKSVLMRYIHKRLYDRLDTLFQTKAYNGDPYIYMNALKGFFVHNKFVFNSLEDLDAGQLRSLANYINKIFSKQDAGTLIGKGGRFGKGKRIDEFYDPVFAAILNDKTMNALDIIQRTQNYTDDRERDIREMTNQVAVMQLKLDKTIKDIIIGDGKNKDNYWGLTAEDFAGLPKDPAQWTTAQRDLAESKVNDAVNAFLNELADGEVRKIKTGKILKTSKQTEDPVYTSKDNEANKITYDYHETFINIINEAIDHQYDEFGEKSIGPNIDYVLKGNKRYYYAMVKQVENGEEIYRAYYVPTKIVNGRYKIVFPKKKTKVGGKFVNLHNQDYYDNIAENQDAFIKAFDATGGDGFYRASENINHLGYKKKSKFNKDINNEDFVVSAWGRFKPMSNEEIPPIEDISRHLQEDVISYKTHANIWSSLGDIRDITSQLFVTMKNRSEATNRKFTVGIKKLKESLSAKDFKELEEEINNILGLDVRIKTFKGKVVSSNNFIGEIDMNYFPRMYEDGEKTSQLFHTINALKAKKSGLMQIISGGISTLEDNKQNGKPLDKKLVNKINKANIAVEDLNDMISIFEAKKDMVLHKTTQREYNNLQATKTIRAGKQRTKHSKPENRRKDKDVLTDHIKNVFNDLHYNDLISDIMPSLAGLKDRPDLIEYTVDHVRSSVGFTDTRATLFGFDMSFPAWAERFSNLPFIKNRYDEKQIAAMITHWSMLNSGNLLRTMSSVTNNTQRLNFGIDHGLSLSLQTWREIDKTDAQGNNIAERIAGESGVLDLVTSLADMLAGGFNQRTELKDSFVPLGQIAMLKGSKAKFLADKGWFYSLFTKVVQSKHPDKKGNALEKEVKMLLSNTWETSHGLKEGTLSKAELKALMSNFRDYGLTQHYINRYVSYGLSYMFPMLQGMDKYLTFTGVEKQMRMEAAYINYLAAIKAGIPKTFREDQKEEQDAWREKYPNVWDEPAVQEVIRTGVYSSMFGMSANFHPKIFKGANRLVFQFKQFPYFQTKNDWILARNWFNSIKGLSAAQQAKEWGKLFIPLPDQVTRINKIDPSDTRAKLRRFFITRGLISVLSVGFFYMPGISEVSGFAKRFVAKKMSRAGLGFGFGNALGRGMTSPPIHIAGQLIVLMMYMMHGTSGDDDEEDRVRQDVFRFFVPFFINLGIEMWGKDAKERVEHTMHFIPGVSELEPLIDPIMD